MAAHTEAGILLAEARNEAKQTQKQVADRLGLHQSRVSRLEAGDGDPPLEDYFTYLDALGTERALHLKKVFGFDWRHLPSPSLKHPDLVILMEAEEALERLSAFRGGDAVPQVLAGQADLLCRRLLEFGEFLLSLDHKIVYVGEIGVGKTTAACRQAGLVADPANPSDLKAMMLDTGGGRTTLCDVFVQAGDRFILNVDPLTDEEVYRLVAELCRSIQEKRDSDATVGSSADFKPPEEVERAIRNMAGLPRPARRKGVGTPAPDPAAELGTATPSLEEFKAEIASRLALWRRTRRSIEFEGGDAIAGRQWLRDTFTSINNGRHPDFSLPGKITITVPFRLIANTPFNVTVVDTRGVDGSAVRPDIVGHLKNKRAVTVLCSKWGSAPDPSLQDVLKHVAETEVDPALFSRVAVLILARAGDALSMRHDSGESAEDVAEGYEIKAGHVADALQRIGQLGVETSAFDAASDASADLTEFLVGKIKALRQAQAIAARATITAVDQMLINVEEAQALATLEVINNELQIFAERHKVPKDRAKPVQTRLLSAIRDRHPRTVWAAARRAGSFWNFDVYQHLGDGAAADAKRRCEPAISGLREIIENHLADPTFETAHTFLGQLLDDVSAWEADFVKAARHHAVAIFKPVLSEATDLWANCDDKYGRGLDYKEVVASLIEEWFDQQGNLQDEFDRRVRRAWRSSVLMPLRTASGIDPQQEAA